MCSDGYFDDNEDEGSSGEMRVESLCRVLRRGRRNDAHWTVRWRIHRRWWNNISKISNLHDPFFSFVVSLFV